MLNFDLTGGRKRGSNHQRVLACWGGRVLVLNLWRKTRCSALQRRSSSLTTPSLLSRGSLQSGRDPKGGPARPAGQVSAQNPARTWGTLLVSLVRYPLAS